MIVTFITSSTRTATSFNINYIFCTMNAEIEQNKIEIISQDIYRMFYPLKVTQDFIFLSSNYNIRDNAITPVGKRHSIVVTLIIFTAMTFWAYRLQSGGFIQVSGMNYISNASSIITIILYIYFASSLIIFYIINFMQSHTKVLLILKIQMIHCHINFKGGVNSFIFWNWIHLFSIFFINFAIYTSYYISHHYFNIIDSFIDLIFITLDIHLVYSIRIIRLLRTYLKHWCNNVLYICTEENVEYYDKLFETYQNILEAYKLYKENTQTLVIYFNTIIIIEQK